MFSANVTTFLKHLLGFLPLASSQPEDEIVRETLVTHSGAVVHTRVREMAGLAPLEPATAGVK
jgi:hypothetical protein